MKNCLKKNKKNRNCYLNIIDVECTEEEIKAYQNELRKNYKRYDKMDSYL